MDDDELKDDDWEWEEAPDGSDDGREMDPEQVRRWAIYLGAALTVVALVGGWYVGLLDSAFRGLVVWLYRSLTLTTVLYTLAFVVGAGFVPLLIFFRLLPGALKRIVARIMWTIGALSLGGDAYVLDQRADGRYEARPVVEKDGTYYVVRDGEREELDGNSDAWSRLGWRKFAVTYEKSDEVFAPIEPEALPEGAHADGGVVVTGIERAGYPEVVVPPKEGDGYVVSMSRVDSLLEGAGGPETAFVAGWQALKNEGGDTAGMGNVALVFSVLVALFGGAAMAYMMF
jgi:hypothetical protein